MPHIDKQSVLDALQGRYVDFLRQYGELRPDGGEWRGPCPLHNGDGPNFTLNNDTGLWNCHSRGCGKPGGDIFDFVHIKEGLRFGDALLRLAEWAGVSSLNTSRPAPVRKQPKPAPPPVFLDQSLVEQTHARLMDTQRMRDWLRQNRGLTEDALRRFQVGMHQHPEDKVAGVWRVTFPVFDTQGRLTNIRRHLFAYKPELTDERRRELGKSKAFQTGLRHDLFPLSVLNGAENVLVVGGEPDAVLANQLGLAAVTGTSGESADWKNKPEWVAALQGKCVTLLYDGDDAGRKGVQKTAHALHSAGVCVSIAQYPEGVKDLTEWVVMHGATAEDVQRVIAEAVPFAPATPTEKDPPIPSYVWEPPVPFSTSALPQFPTEAFPPVLGDYATEFAASSKTPVDMTGMMALANVAAAGARRCQVQIGRTHSEPLNIWAIVVMEPGSRKSAVMDMAAPLREYEARLASAAASDIASAKARRTIEEKRLEHLQAHAAKETDPAKRDALIQQAEELAGELTVIPPTPRLLADDITPERLGGLMADNAGAMTIQTAEGGIFGLLAGRYSKGEPNLDVFLKGHAGDEIRVDRMGDKQGGKPVFVKRPALTMGLLIQPDVLASFKDTPAFRGRGLTGRGLYALPPSLAGTRKYEDRPVDPEVKRRYAQAIERILDLPDAGTEDDPTLRHSLLLTGDALNLWAEYADAVEARQAEGEDLSGIKDWASKLAGAVARIAGGFHLVEHAGGDWRKPISVETVAAAWAVGEYLIPHALAAFGEMRADPNAVLARRALGWMKRKHIERFTLTECQRAHTGSVLVKAEEMQAALSVLMDRGYIRAEAQPPREPGTVGRPGGQAYAVNPAVHSGKEKAG